MAFKLLGPVREGQGGFSGHGQGGAEWAFPVLTHTSSLTQILAVA